MNKEEIWKAALGQIELEVSPGIYSTWFVGTSIKEIKDGVVNISCSLKYKKDWIQDRYFGLIKRSLQKVIGKSVDIAFSVDLESAPLVETLGPLFEKKEIGKENANSESGIVSNFTFENFIVGSNNRLAYAVAESIAENPGTVYNPLFLHSGVGLGKTHLLQAIGNAIIKKGGGVKVLYKTGETFTNELIESIQKRGAPAKFRNKYRKVDVLLVDDVQFIAGRESTQEEFFHTFNALHMAKKQIVLTSDKPPKDISKLEERLSSRFAMGMIADIQMPDVDMRNAILRAKRDTLKIKASNEVVDYIAQNVNTNIRELEGVFIQIATFAKTQTRDITLEFAKNFLEKTGNRREINISEIIKAVAKYYSLDPKDLKGKRRIKEIVLPRQIAMYLARVANETPFMTIGEALGGRDHTTIIHGVEKIEKTLPKNTKVRQDIQNIRQNLSALSY